MGGHVFELPEESNDHTQFSKTMDKLKEHIKTAYRDMPGVHKPIHSNDGPTYYKATSTIA